MNRNRIKVVINKPIEKVFEFTINPENTPLWISHIKKEVSDKYPPEIGTIYKNRGSSNTWDYYTVTELQKNKIFTMKSSNGKYFVRYTYKRLSKTKTELDYLEWVVEGKLDNPFDQRVLDRLKQVIESKQ